MFCLSYEQDIRVVVVIGVVPGRIRHLYGGGLAWSWSRARASLKRTLLLIVSEQGLEVHLGHDSTAAAATTVHSEVSSFWA